MSIYCLLRSWCMFWFVFEPWKVFKKSLLPYWKLQLAIYLLLGKECFGGILLKSVVLLFFVKKCTIFGPLPPPPPPPDPSWSVLQKMWKLMISECEIFITLWKSVHIWVFDLLTYVLCAYKKLKNEWSFRWTYITLGGFFWNWGA